MLSLFLNKKPSSTLHVFLPLKSPNIWFLACQNVKFAAQYVFFLFSQKCSTMRDISLCLARRTIKHKYLHQMSTENGHVEDILCSKIRAWSIMSVFLLPENLPYIYPGLLKKTRTAMSVFRFQRLHLNSIFSFSSQNLPISLFLRDRRPRILSLIAMYTSLSKNKLLLCLMFLPSESGKQLYTSQPAKT